jgi:hypothetical protein
MNIPVEVPTQKNPISKVLPHPTKELPVIKPAMQGDFLEQMSLTTTIHELLLKVTKNGTVFWVGAAVPIGTTNLTKIQVFFHPTVVQAGQVIATEGDYPEFKGGWSSSIQRYVELEGCQLAASRQVAMLVPFTTMAAVSLGGPNNMFTADPVGTLKQITAAIQDRFISFGIPIFPAPELTAVGVTSFSSGIKAMRMFIDAMKPSGLVREVIDLDSPFIKTEPADLTLSPGAQSSCYTQRSRSNPPPGYKFLPTSSFAKLPKLNNDPGQHAHACIGRMMYHMAMITSVIT